MGPVVAGVGARGTWGTWVGVVSRGHDEAALVGRTQRDLRHGLLLGVVGGLEGRALGPPAVAAAGGVGVDLAWIIWAMANAGAAWDRGPLLPFLTASRRRCLWGDSLAWDVDGREGR